MNKPYAGLVAACTAAPPAAAVVLGSGLSPVARKFSRALSISFADVPGLPVPTVHGHGGRLTVGEWGGKAPLLFEGRVHRYEGHSWDTVIRPVQIAAALGAKVLLLTNAAGGIHDALDPGRLMALRDHLEWTRPNPWRHPGPAIGPTRPSPYSARLLQLLTDVAAAQDIPLLHGVYAQLTGPCYETPAEIRALRTWGADAVGMSTAREAQAGADLGMECVALSFITNRAAGLSASPLDHREVLSTAAAGAELLGVLLDGFLNRLTM